MDGIWMGYGWDMPEDGRSDGWFSFPPASPYGILSLRGRLPQLAPVNVSTPLPTPCFPHLPSINRLPPKRLRSQSNIQQTHCHRTIQTGEPTGERTGEPKPRLRKKRLPLSRPPRRIFVTKPPSQEPPWPPRTARRSPIRDRQTTSFFTRRTFDGSTTRRRCPRIARSPSPRNRVPPSPPPSCRSWPPSTTSRRAG